MLPALSIILVSTGGWALGMRSLMIMTQGEDFVIFADAKGLRDRTIFYALRHPQRLAAAGDRPGPRAGPDRVGRGAGRSHLRLPRHRHRALPGHPRLRLLLVQGIVFVVIVSIGLATFILDIIYPLLDPRITYRRA